MTWAESRLNLFCKCFFGFLAATGVTHALQFHGNASCTAASTMLRKYVADNGTQLAIGEFLLAAFAARPPIIGTRLNSRTLQI